MGRGVIVGKLVGSHDGVLEGSTVTVGMDVGSMVGVSDGKCDDGIEDGKGVDGLNDAAPEGIDDGHRDGEVLLVGISSALTDCILEANRRNIDIGIKQRRVRARRLCVIAYGGSLNAVLNTVHECDSFPSY